VTTQGPNDKTREIAQLAHDLNNALHAITSAIEIVRRRLPAADERAASALGAAKRNVDTAAQLAHRLLLLSGQGAGVPGKLVEKAAADKLAGLRVLIIEDESLIAMHVEDLVCELGCEVIGVVASVPKALERLARADVELALLDVQLGDAPAYPVAAALKERNVPFVFMSGYGQIAEPWRDRPALQKPFDLEQARSEMERALQL
jgi:CheY-like chemotaxis protein